VYWNQTKTKTTKQSVWTAIGAISTCVACEEKDPLALIANSKLMSRQPAANSEYRRSRRRSLSRRKTSTTTPTPRPTNTADPPPHLPHIAHRTTSTSTAAVEEEEEKSAVQREHRIESDRMGSVALVLDTRRSQQPKTPEHSKTHRVARERGEWRQSGSGWQKKV